MKELRGSASASVAASMQQCLALLSDIERYPSWCPDVVREAEVLERDGTGQARRARATLHVSAGPLVKDFRLVLAVSVESPATINLTRVPHDPSDQEQFRVTWRVQDGGQARISLQLEANLSVPRLLPLGGTGDSIAAQLVAAAKTALSHAP